MKTLVKSRIALSAMALVSAFAVSHFAIADEPAAPAAPAAKERPKGGGGMAILKDLNLTDAQKAQVKEIMAAQKVKREAIKADTTLSDKDKRKQGRDLREDTNAKIRAILTPEQQAKFDAAIAEQKANRGGKKDKPAA